MQKDTIKLLGIIGKPLDHSLSPKIFNQIFKKLKLPYRYLPFQVDKKHLKNLIVCMKLVDVEGLNITTPYKKAVIPFLDYLDPFAKKCGAINTIVRKKNLFIGFNTDGPGFVQSLKKVGKVNPKNKRVAIIGSGGAAKAIAAALAEAKAKKIVIFNRNSKKTKYRRIFPNVDILIQATSIQPKLPLHLLPKWALVCDIVYHPLWTLTLKKAKKLKLKTMDGLWMLCFQATMNLKHWMGKKVAPLLLRKIALAGLKNTKKR